MYDATAIAPAAPNNLAELPVTQRAVYSFLARYRGQTLVNYKLDLKVFLVWCDEHRIPPLLITRGDLELYARYLETLISPATNRPLAPATVARRLGTVIVFFKYAAMDDFITKDPALAVRRPKVDMEQQSRPFLTPLEYAALLKASKPTPAAHALVALLGEMGLRISEACSLDIADIDVVGAYEVIRFVGKGNKGAEMPLPVPVMRAVHEAIRGRDVGPVLLNEWGNRMTRMNAGNLLTNLAKAAGLTAHVTPHSLRRTFVTAGLLNGVPLRDMQVAARHADPKMTVRYDRMVGGHDRNAVHRVAGYLSSMAG
jgi:site-specific recombinase XerD